MCYVPVYSVQSCKCFMFFSHAQVGASPAHSTMLKPLATQRGRAAEAETQRAGKQQSWLQCRRQKWGQLQLQQLLLQRQAQPARRRLARRREAEALAAAMD